MRVSFECEVQSANTDISGVVQSKKAVNAYFLSKEVTTFSL